jgi:PHP family Zn ribbon phosphoesterase
MKEFLKITGSAFIGCFLAIWAFGKCKNSVCAETTGKQAEKVAKKVEEKVDELQAKKVAKKVEEKVDELQAKKEEIQKENPTFVDVETEEPQKQAVKTEKLVSTAMEVAQAIY